MSENNPIGRPSKYKPEYCEQLIEYFDVEPYREVQKQVVTKQGDVIEISENEANDFPTLAGFAIQIGVNRDTLREWTREHPEFSVAYKQVIEFQERFITVNGLKGLTNPAFTIFTAKNVLKWRDKQPGEDDHKVEHAGKVEIQNTDINDRISQLKDK